MSTRQAHVLGAGPAGLCCALRLRQLGWAVQVSASAPRQGPLVLLNPVTQALLADIAGPQGGLLDDAHVISERQLAWSAHEPPRTLPHEARAISLAALTSALADRAQQAGVQIRPGGEFAPPAGTWVIQATGRRGLSPDALLTFGQRRAISAPVRLRKGVSATCCRLEAVPGGWLFLIPTGQDRGVLQGVSARPFDDATDRLLDLCERSHYAGECVEALLADAVAFAAMPSLHLGPARPGQILVGDAAMAYDPISGDGIGSGVRSAVLAAAVMEAAAQMRAGAGRDQATTPTPGQPLGVPVHEGLAHYHRRLAHAARVHVQRCIGMYESALHAHTWQDELHAMHTGLGRLAPDEQPLRHTLSPHGLVPHPGPLPAYPASTLSSQEAA